MTALPIAFQTNTSKYKFLGTPSLVNAYAEKQGSDAKSPLAVLHAHGLTSLVTVTDTPSRGMIYLEDLDCIYDVHPSGVYKVTYSGGSYSATRIGVVPGTDVVQISRNQASPVQITILSSSGTFYIESDSMKIVSDSDLPTPVSQVCAGGYTAYGIEDGRVFLSSLNDTSVIDALDYATAEQASDKLVGLFYDRGNLYVFGTQTVETWRNTGNADFPFEPVTTQTIQKGLIARDAVASLDNTVFFVGSDCVVYRISGGSVQRVSNHGIERLIKSDSGRSSIIADSYNSEGHAFLVLTGTDWTRIYDASTGSWSTRESKSLGKWRARFSAPAWGKNIFADTLSGKLLYLDDTAFDEDGDEMVWGVDSPTLHAFPHGGIVDAIYFDLGTGYGDVSSASQGYDPIAMLSWSTDGGNTWRGNREIEIGRSGERVRVVARRLGRFGPLGMQFRLRVSDPIVRALAASDVSVRLLKR